MDWVTIRKLIRASEETYVVSLPDDTTVFILDIDATDDETHGAQQVAFVHGYYDHWMYNPLLLFDGDRGQLISFKLRPGNTHASCDSASILARVIRRIKAGFRLAFCCRQLSFRRWNDLRGSPDELRFGGFLVVPDDHRIADSQVR